MTMHIEKYVTPRRQTGIVRRFYTLLSLILMTLAVVSLPLAWISWEINGLDAAKTHLANGAFTLLLMLAGINERFSPRPLIEHRLRQQVRTLASQWADAFYTTCAWVMVILLAVSFCLS